jgi:hypothetical protein
MFISLISRDPEHLQGSQTVKQLWLHQCHSFVETARLQGLHQQLCCKRRRCQARPRRMLPTGQPFSECAGPAAQLPAAWRQAQHSLAAPGASSSEEQGHDRP